MYAEREIGGFFLDVTPNREAIARYGLTVRQVLDVVESTIGGMDVSTTYEGRERYRINVRYPRELRDNLEAIRDVLVPIAPLGASVARDSRGFSVQHERWQSLAGIAPAGGMGGGMAPGGDAAMGGAEMSGGGMARRRVWVEVVARPRPSFRSASSPAWRR